jgi:hypothetical protein
MVNVKREADTVIKSYNYNNNNNNNNNNIFYLLHLGLLPGGSGYFTCKQNMNLVTTKFKSGGLHENHVVATWNVGNRLSAEDRPKLSACQILRGILLYSFSSLIRIWRVCQANNKQIVWIRKTN